MTDAPAAPPVHWKLVVDSRDPHAQADFWGAALHYEVEDNSAFVERLPSSSTAARPSET